MEDRKKLSLSPKDSDRSQLLLSHISVGFLMHTYESWQLPATFSSYSIKAPASVSGVVGIMHTIPAAAGVLCVLRSPLPSAFWTRTASTLL